MWYFETTFCYSNVLFFKIVAFCIFLEAIKQNISEKFYSCFIHKVTKWLLVQILFVYFLYSPRRQVLKEPVKK